MEKNCAFQYTITRGNIFKNITIVENQTSLTLEEAKQLWNKYYPDFVKNIKEGNSIEVCIWINMLDEYSFGEKLYHIPHNAELDGDYIIEKVVNYFPSFLK